MHTVKPVVLYSGYAFLVVISFLLPWWLAVPLLIAPLPFIPFHYIVLPIGIIFDTVYGHTISGFPYHTFRYTLAMMCAVIVVTLLKKVLRL